MVPLNLIRYALFKTFSIFFFELVFYLKYGDVPFPVAGM